MNRPKTGSSAKYLVVIFLILIIFGITAKWFVNFSKIPLLTSVSKIVEVHSDYSKLDSCIFKLYNAENNCRMYIVSGEKSYYSQFATEIKEIALAVDSLNSSSSGENALSTETFNALIQQKKLRTNQLMSLKKTADSLLNFTVAVEKEVEHNKPANRAFTARRFLNIVRIDTLKPAVVVEQKKKFFGRIFSALKTKKEKQPDSSKATLIKTTISADTSSVGIAYNNLQLNAINSYYQRLYRINKTLKSREKELLDVNHKLIGSIVESLKQYKDAEKGYYLRVQQIVNTSTMGTVKNMDIFTMILIGLIFGLLLFVFYIIYNFYKTEKSLIDYSKKADSYALSKSRFLANMSHEIRTPLNSIVGFSEQMNQIELLPQQKEQINAIRNSSVMLLDVVNDILDFSKYETGKISLESVPFSVNTAIKDVFDSMKVQVAKKKIGLILNMPIDEELYIQGDPLRLKQVVMNLLSNAIKFTDEGSVTLNANLTRNATNHGVLKVSIVDTGMGINPVDQRIIFDEFAQVYYASTKGKQQGTGLGLAICKKIVEFQGGTIRVRSEMGKGSVFSFEVTYPVVIKPISVEPPVTKFTTNAKMLEGKRILLADDNMLNILLASTILKKYKINFDAAYDGKEAWSLFVDNEYDIVLTDIQMPEMGGIELTQKIRTHTQVEKQNIPILGVTANVMEEDRTKYLESGMNELVLKPFLEQELIEKMLAFVK